MSAGPTTVVASAARTATGQSAAIVSAGTLPRSTLVRDAQCAMRMATTTAKVKNFAVLGDVYRIVWTIGGTTPSFTFSVVETVN